MTRACRPTRHAGRSAKAYLGALNKIVMKRQRDIPARPRAEGSFD